MSFFGKKKVTCDVIVHVFEKKKKEKRFMCWKKKRLKKKRFTRWKKKKVGKKKKRLKTQIQANVGLECGSKPTLNLGLMISPYYLYLARTYFLPF